MIPLGLKVVYTIFVCALVPIYWREYGPANFLWFSDIALLALVPALWLENALLVSMLAISVVFFEALWNLDFFFRLPTGKPLIGSSRRIVILRSFERTYGGRLRLEWQVQWSRKSRTIHGNRAASYW